MKMLMKYKKELAAAFILLLAAMFLTELIPDPRTIELTPELMALSFALLLLPLFAAIPSGYLIAKKTKELNPAIFVPALGIALATLVMLGIGFAQISIAPDSEIQKEMDKATEMGVNMFDEMSVQDFRAFTLSSLMLGAVFMAVMNFALGLFGGFTGRTLAGIKGKKK